MVIKSIKSQEDGLNVIWNDGSYEIFPWLWIRDHSEMKKIFILIQSRGKLTCLVRHLKIL